MTQSVEHLTAVPGYRFYLFPKRNGERAFLAYAQSAPDVPIGVIRFGPRRVGNDEGGILWDVYSLHVRRSHRGNGVAKALHRLALEHSDHEGHMLRVQAKPAAKYAAVFVRLREQRIEFEGREELPGMSAVDP